MAILLSRQCNAAGHHAYGNAIYSQQLVRPTNATIASHEQWLACCHTLARLADDEFRLTARSQLASWLRSAYSRWLWGFDVLWDHDHFASGSEPCYLSATALQHAMVKSFATASPIEPSAPVSLPCACRITGPFTQPLCIPGNTPVLGNAAGTARVGQLLQGILTPLLGNTNASTEAEPLDGIACLPTLPGLPPQLGSNVPAASPAPVAAAPLPQQAHSQTAAIVGGVGRPILHVQLLSYHSSMHQEQGAVAGHGDTQTGL